MLDYTANALGTGTRNAEVPFVVHTFPESIFSEFVYDHFNFVRGTAFVLAIVL